MSYFKKFPLINYDMNERDYLVVNVTRPIRENPRFNDRAFYVDYTIQDGDTPISIADKFYDDPELAWTILRVNTIVDLYSEWPMSYQELMMYVDATYDDAYAVHHYESRTSGAVVDEDYDESDRVSVLNIEHEQKVNDNKREIKLIDPTYINSYVKDHNDSVEVEL